MESRKKLSAACTFSSLPEFILAVLLCLHQLNPSTDWFLIIIDPFAALKLCFLTPLTRLTDELFFNSFYGRVTHVGAAAYNSWEELVKQEGSLWPKMTLDLVQVLGDRGSLTEITPMLDGSHPHGADPEPESSFLKRHKVESLQILPLTSCYLQSFYWSLFHSALKRRGKIPFIWFRCAGHRPHLKPAGW